MKQKNYETGKLGEKLAADFLSKNGYEIIEKNFHTKFGEIDLIVTKDGKLVFVEVKLKVGDDFGTPEEMIKKGKIRQVERTAQSFLIKNPQYEELADSFQIDAVCIVLTENHEVLRLNHYENIS